MNTICTSTPPLCLGVILSQALGQLYLYRSEEFCLLGYKIVYIIKSELVFRRIVTSVFRVKEEARQEPTMK
jgi:hypothetical protein